MTVGRWRLIRNIAIAIAIGVLVVQLVFVVPLFADLFQRLPTDGDVPPDIPDPRNGDRMRNAMALQPLFIASALAALYAWWKAKPRNNSEPDKPSTP